MIVDSKGRSGQSGGGWKSDQKPPKMVAQGAAATAHVFYTKGDGVLPSHDLDQDVTSPTRPRTSSQTKKMAHLWQEAETSTNGLTGQKKPGFVHLIS